MGCMLNEALIGDLLGRAGLIDSSGLSRFRELQQREGVSLSNDLAKLEFADEQSIFAAIAESLHLEVISEEKPEILAEVIGLLPSNFCRKRLAVPLSLQGKILRVAFADPTDY